MLNGRFIYVPITKGAEDLMAWISGQIGLLPGHHGKVLWTYGRHTYIVTPGQDWMVPAHRWPQHNTERRDGRRVWLPDVHGFGVVTLPDGRHYLVAETGDTRGHNPKTVQDLKRWVQKEAKLPHVRYARWFIRRVRPYEFYVDSYQPWRCYEYEVERRRVKHTV